MWFKLLEGGAVKSTVENLEAAANGENYEWTDMCVKLYTDFGFKHNGNFMHYKL